MSRTLSYRRIFKRPRQTDLCVRDEMVMVTLDGKPAAEFHVALVWDLLRDELVFMNSEYLDGPMARRKREAVAAGEEGRRTT